MAKRTIELPVWQVVALAAGAVLVAAAALRRCAGGGPVLGAGPFPQ